MSNAKKYHSIFAPSTSEERKQNFISYWAFSQQHSGTLFEEDKDLEKKRAKLKSFQKTPVRTKQPLSDSDSFYKNCVKLQDDPKQMDPKILLTTCIYKFARHEWVGISGAWDSVPSLADSKTITDKISRVHLAEEFCHKRLFHEMLRTFHLEKVEWVPLGPISQMVYKFFPRLPEVIMAPLAFVTEMMGITFYQQLDDLFDEILADEPEARQRCRELLHEIMVDELAHIGQRRNFLGPIGTKISQMIVPPLFRMFFHDIPEIGILFDTDKMIKDGLAFDFSTIPKALMERTWVPSYCQV